MPGIKLAFNFTGPPQSDQARLFELARLQLSAFFYWITYDVNRRRGGFWPGGFFPLDLAFRGDWGNGLQRAFMTVTANWETRMHAVGAEGYFKASIRRNPESISWSWAMEWNNNIRLIGFMGERNSVEALIRQFPALRVSLISDNTSGITRSRREVPPAEEDDGHF